MKTVAKSRATSPHHKLSDSERECRSAKKLKLKSKSRHARGKAQKSVRSTQSTLLITSPKEGNIPRVQHSDLTSDKMGPVNLHLQSRKSKFLFTPDQLTGYRS